MGERSDNGGLNGTIYRPKDDFPTAKLCDKFPLEVTSSSSCISEMD